MQQPAYYTAGIILADAFAHYPLMQYAFEGNSKATKTKRITKLYGRCAKAAHLYGGVILMPDSNGALIWLPGYSFPLGLKQEIRSGMAALPFELGPKATLRLMNHDAEPDRWIKQHASSTFGYVWCVGVKDAARGKGHSRVLIEQSISEMRAKGMTEFWLKTEDPKNVLIYQRIGFELMHQMVVKSSGITCWIMRKK